jgi:predicted deacylase
MTETMPRVELVPPDIAAYRNGNVGVDWVWRWTAAAPGPHVAVVAAVHGNELCGPIVVDRLHRLGIRPARGTLTLALANVAAYLSFDAQRPTASRFLDEDMNRVWDPAVLDGPRRTAERVRARALRPLLAEADALLDLHSMLHEGDPLILSGPTARGATLARAIGLPAWVVADAGHAAGLRLIDMPPFGDPDAAQTAILVECGQHWRRATAAVALEATIRFLAHFGIVDSAVFAAHRPAPGPQAAGGFVRVTDVVTVRTDRFRFTPDAHGMSVVPRAGTVIAWDGDDAVRTPYDDCVLVMPSRRARAGQTAVRLGRREP